MRPQLHDGPAEERLSCSTLRAVDDPERIENLQQMLSSFNHRCRNSLNGIKMSLYLFRREVDGPMPRHCLELERTYQELEVLFDRLQMIYRPLSLTLVRSPVGQLFNEHLPSWRSRFSRRARILELIPPEVDVPGDFDPMQLGVALDALVGWRADSGPADWNAVLSWRMVDDYFEVRWDEGRPTNGGLASEPEPDAPEGNKPNARIESLAYPILKRIIGAHGGFVETIDDPSFVVTLRWPRFQASKQGA